MCIPTNGRAAQGHACWYLLVLLADSWRDASGVASSSFALFLLLWSFTAAGIQ